MLNRECEAPIHFKRLIIVLLVLGALGGADFASAQERPQPTFAASLLYGNILPADHWIPLDLRLQNPTDRPIEGYVAARTGGADDTELRTLVHIPPRSRVKQNTFAYFAPHLETQKPLTTLLWHDAGGGVVAREPLVGKTAGAGEDDLPARLVVIADLRAIRLEGYAEVDALLLVEQLGKTLSYPVGAAGIAGGHLPRVPLVYESVLAVVLDEVDLAALDSTQQHALLQYVRDGGTLVLPAPIGASDPRGTWLEPYLPVRIIGHREASTLPLDDAPPLPLGGPMNVTEALPDAGTVVLEGGGYVHAAYKPLGRGRVVFTSFPAGALMASLDDAASASTQAIRPVDFWTGLLGAEQAGADWRQSELAARQIPLLQRMIGKTAPAWGVAFWIVTVYLALALIAQLALGGTRRPMAFAAAGGIAVLVTIGLFGTRLAISHRQPFLVAGIATLDMDPGGGGTLQESLAYVGINDPSMALETEGPGTSIRPITGKDATIVLPAFNIPGAGVLSDRVDHVWKVTSSLPEQMKLTVQGMFGPEGLQLTVDNTTGAPVEAPILVVDGSAISLQDLPEGPSRHVAGAPNPPGSFVNATVFTTESAKLRGDIIQARMTPRHDAMMPVRTERPVRLIGWLDASAAPRMIHPSASVKETVYRQAVAIQADVSLQPAPAGTRVKIGRAFVPLARIGPSPLYDFTRREWIESRQPMDLELRFGRPKTTDNVKLQKATLEVNIDAPRHVVTVEHARSTAGEVLARWTNPVGPQPPVTFDLKAGDVDEAGRVVLRISVQTTAVPAAGEIPTPWQVQELGLSLQGQAQ